MNQDSLVDFIVIGAHKAATTSVCDLLNRHPEIFICHPKEPNFFAHDEKWSRGISSYQELFAAADGCLKGDGSTNYTMQGKYPLAAERIAETVPQVKLIYMVRHPIERIESHWLFFRKTGWVIEEDINDAVRENSNIVDISLYYRQIQRYLDLFPREQIHIEFFEDFKADPSSVLRRLCDFLQVADFHYDEEDLTNPRNPSVGQRGDNQLLMRLRRVPGFRSLRDWIPSAAIDILKKPLTTRLEKPVWRPEVKQKLVQMIRPDTDQFLRLVGQPPDRWKFED